MLNDGQPIWRPHYKSPSWVWGSMKVSHWEIVTQTRYGVESFGKLYTGVRVFPDGRLVINGQESQCDSVEEAKEMGMTTYLLTSEGE